MRQKIVMSHFSDFSFKFGWFHVFLSACLLLFVCASHVEDSSIETQKEIKTETSLSSNDTAYDSNATSTILQTVAAVLPPKGDAEKEHKNSMSIFFILIVIVLSILLVHVLLVTKFRYVPDSLAIIFLGSLIGLVLFVSGGDWRNEEAFSPNAFFLLLLPPIIFESGYNLHKGNFFANFTSILVFAVFGTIVSAFVIGGGIYILGQADLIYNLSVVESFAFGSTISAVDPVATLAIFQAIKVDQILYMLVFGESMLNDAVSIVLTTTVMELNKPQFQEMSAGEALATSIGRFCLMFFGSAGVGVVAGLISALLLKYVNLHNTPSLEYGVMLVFAYLPYGFAEGVNLSGIMAILFCGIVMSHYTHFNLSAMTQVTVQQTFRTLAFIAESCVFAYLGMAPFTFPMIFKPAFICWAIILCLVSRAANIFPLSCVVNYFREHKITRKMQFLMWFSGLRGAIAFALSLHTDYRDTKTRRVVVTTTYCVVLFTTIVLGGSTMPLTNFLNGWRKQEVKRNRRRRRRRAISPATTSKSEKFGGLTISKTLELGPTVEIEEYSVSEHTESEGVDGLANNVDRLKKQSTLQMRGAAALSGLANFDAKYLRPFFIRKFTQQEKKDNTSKLTDLALRWYREVRQESEGEERESSVADEEETLFEKRSISSNHKTDNSTGNNSVVDDSIRLI